MSKMLFRFLLACFCFGAFTLLTGCSPPTASETGIEPSMDVSPDGKTLVFSGYGEGGSDLFLMDLKTKKVTRVKKTEWAEGYPSFSPDGKRIVYAAWLPDESRNGALRHTESCLFTCLRDGSDIKRLTNPRSKADAYPSFSQDGKYIVFERGQSNVADVYRMRSNGLDVKRITNADYGCVIRPRFCRDNKTILFEAFHNEDEAAGMKIARTDVGRSHLPRQAFKMGWSNYSPYPAFKGDAVTFVSDYPRRYTHDVYFARSLADAPTAMNISRYGEGARNCVLMPDNETILFLLNNTELWTVDTSGTNAHQLADFRLFDDPLNWKP